MSGYGVRSILGINRVLGLTWVGPVAAALGELRVVTDKWKSGVEKLRFARKSPKMVFGLLNRIGTKKLWKLNS